MIVPFDIRTLGFGPLFLSTVGKGLDFTIAALSSRETYLAFS